MKIVRALVMIVAVYVTIDFLDPSVPGVFFFDSENLFIDGAVQAKATTSDRVLPPRVGAGPIEIDPALRIISVVGDARPVVTSAVLSRAPSHRPRHALIASALDEDHLG